MGDEYEGDFADDVSANDEEEGPRGAGKGKGVGRGKGKGKGGKRGPPTTYAASENSEQEDYQASDADGAESASDEGNGGEGLSGYQQQQDDQGSEDFDGDSVDQQDAREADGRGGGAEDAGPDPYGNQPYYSESEDQDDAYDEDEEFAEIPDRAPVYEEPEPGDDNADDEEEAEQDEEEDYLTGDGGEQSRSFIGGKGLLSTEQQDETAAGSDDEFDASFNLNRGDGGVGLMADSLDDLRKRKRDEENEQDTTDEYGLDVFDAENVDVGDLLEGGLVGKRARLDGEVDTAAFVDFD